MVAVPCLSPDDACTVYRHHGGPSKRWCCRAREMYDQGALSDERLEATCPTLKARGEGWQEVEA